MALLILAFAAGSILPVGSAMAMEAGTSAEMVDHAHVKDLCTDCAASAMSAEDCGLACCLPSAAVLPEQAALPRRKAEGYASPGGVLTIGHRDPPDPSPPRAVERS